jgi:hypothetical protein
MSCGSAFSQRSSWLILARSRWLVQQHIGLRHHGTGQHRQPLPATAQLFQRFVPQGLGDFQRIQRDIDAPAFARSLFNGQRFQRRGSKRRIHQGRRHVLLDVADAQPARAGDLAFGCLHRAGNAAQQRGLAAAIGCDKPDAVAGIDDKVQVGKQRRAQRHAEITDVDESHDRSLVLPAITMVQGTQPSSDVVSAQRLIDAGARKSARRRMATEGRPGRDFRRSLWSALQTHLQGVDRTARTIMVEKCHDAVLLSQSSEPSK